MRLTAFFSRHRPVANLPVLADAATCPAHLTERDHQLELYRAEQVAHDLTEARIQSAYWHERCERAEHLHGEWR